MKDGDFFLYENFSFKKWYCSSLILLLIVSPKAQINYYSQSLIITLDIKRLSLNQRD